MAEASGHWTFHDERTWTLAQVKQQAGSLGQIVEEGIVWPIVFTQGYLAMRPLPLPA